MTRWLMDKTTDKEDFPDIVTYGTLMVWTAKKRKSAPVELNEIQLSQEMKLEIFMWQIKGGNYGGWRGLFDMPL